MPILKNRSVQQKMILIIMAMSSVALLFACSVFIAYDFITFRQAMVRDLSILASIMGENNTAAALVFNDQSAAEGILASLNAQPHIVYARIYTKDGAVFSSYHRSDLGHESSSLPPLTEESYHHFENDHLDVLRPIHFDGERIGTVYIRSDLQELRGRRNRYMSIVLVALITSSLVVLPLSSRLRRIISEPILHLVHTMKIVKTNKDYTVRATKHNDDEIGTLIEDFNAMLTEIQTRDTALREANENLEKHVEERTKELQQEIIECRQAEEAAETANRAKSEFLANMSHELRTPLNAILGYAQILQKESGLTPKQKKELSTIQRSGDHLLSLINDILDLSKIEADKMELNLSDFHFPPMLKNIADLFRVRAEQKGITLHYEPLSDLPVAVRGDEQKLRQVLMNLLSNAVKFTDTGGVAFKVGYHEDNIRFQIEDTGVGIAQESLEDIFESFQQVGKKSLTTKGTGLGLSISKQLVKLMGGELRVNSELGADSTFWFELALPEVKEIAATASSDESPSCGRTNRAQTVMGYEGQRRKVLIVEDNAENRDLLANMLAPLDFELLEAVDGKQGVAKTIDWHPDLILMDLRMPVMDGFEAMR
ncbi:MAG: ATP-binding protein, partial [Candidatus Poribacteria bacterium]|nr:ATP-binding protein [Candidatus Poribacteria bacterium]